MKKIKKAAKRFHFRYFEKYRQDKKLAQKLDKIMILFGLVGSFSTLIQLIRIYATHNVAGISIYSWMGYLVVTTAWFTYGFLHKSRPLVLVNFIGIITNTAIISGCIMFR
jgi:uncharacterized protein with PQ loop repeat